MKPLHLLLIGLSVVLVLAGGTALAYSELVVKEVVHYKMDVVVDERAGVNGDEDAIHFGKVPPGGISRKRIDFTNSYPYPIEATISFSGELGRWVYSDPNQIIVEPGTKHTFVVVADIPLDGKYGTYEGSIKVVLKRAFT